MYHQPTPQRAERNTAVLLCGPIGQEYIRSHRTLQRIADQLATLGYHALRFDLSGCGDSAGEFADACMADWTADLQCAASELREGSGVGRVVVLGVRMGASIAALAASTPGCADGLVLWDPVVSGRDYLEEIRAHHTRYMNGSFATANPPGGVGPAVEEKKMEEILGFALTEGLAGELDQLDLDNLRLDLGNPCLVLQTEDQDLNRLFT